jgi:oligoribonuclease
MTASANNLIWIDMEMTGLNPERERIIEIATIVTDSQLNVIAEGPVYAIHQADELLDEMDSWNTKQHNGSGLVKRVKESTVTEAEAEALHARLRTFFSLPFVRREHFKRISVTLGTRGGFWPA